MKQLVIFASGSGSNAENLIRHFKNHRNITVSAVLTNNKDAGVIARTEKLNIPCRVFAKKQFDDGTVLNFLKEIKTDYIVLAGFLLLIPITIIDSFPGHLINLHPALLPLHGGKGFYGSCVHESVIKSGAIMSGITVHFVNEHFDEGKILFQAACHVSKTETAESLSKKIHELEYQYLPVVVEKLIR